MGHSALHSLDGVGARGLYQDQLIMMSLDKFSGKSLRSAVNNPFLLWRPLWSACLAHPPSQAQSWHKPISEFVAAMWQLFSILNNTIGMAWPYVRCDYQGWPPHNGTQYACYDPQLVPHVVTHAHGHTAHFYVQGEQLDYLSTILWWSSSNRSSCSIVRFQVPTCHQILREKNRDAHIQSVAS